MSIQVTPELIKKIAKGTIFGIHYKRKDGTTGSMTGRFGVKCDLKDPTAPKKVVDPSEEPKTYITLHSSNKDTSSEEGKKKGYRRIIIENIISMTVRGVTIDLRDLKNITLMESMKAIETAMANGFEVNEYECIPGDYESQVDERLVA